MYTNFKTAINTKLATVSKIQYLTDDPTLDNVTGFPAAVVVPSDQESDYETTTENQRVYAFDIFLLYDAKGTTISNAIDALYDLVDDVLDLFDDDPRLTGTLTVPTGYTMLDIRPTSGGWGQITERNLITATVKVRALISYDTTA